VLYLMEEGLTVDGPRHDERRCPPTGRPLVEIMCPRNITMKGYLKPPRRTGYAFRRLFHSALAVMQPYALQGSRPSKTSSFSARENNPSLRSRTCSTATQPSRRAVVASRRQVGSRRRALRRSEARAT